MQIRIYKNRITLVPERPDETVMVRTVWRMLVECSGTTRSLTPIGEFVPERNHDAQFVIEGTGADQLPEFQDIKVDFACRVSCDICNRYRDLNKGDSIPPCCGKLMEFVD